MKYGSPTYTSSLNCACGCRCRGYDDSSPDIHPSELKVTDKVKVFVHAQEDRQGDSRIAITTIMWSV